MSKIDLRSDTVTKPTKEMRAVIANADVGDDVFGDDPSVNALQDFAANLLGKEAALFCPTGTQSNLVGILAHCQRGDEYIVGQSAHTYLYEGGGAAVLGSVQPQPLEYGDVDGVIPPEKIKGAIKEDDAHFAKTKLICLENTKGGRPLPDGYVREVKQVADAHGLSMHLDGARLFNAAVKTGQSVKDLAADFDSVSICLSKGLGAPVGSLLVGSAEIVNKAHRWRKMTGGGMRQAGILAAAGLYALQNNVARLADDHANAQKLADGLRDMNGVEVLDGSGLTNMVFVRVDETRVDALSEHAEAAGMILPAGSNVRLVTHLDVSADDIERVLEVFQKSL
ncbi:MAG: low-specificity L-threonine aldolase [Sphingomonadales bacterium]|nr:low-specificity L-threonine aldolase [Sphingomonadales bacterium]